MKTVESSFLSQVETRAFPHTTNKSVNIRIPSLVPVASCLASSSVFTSIYLKLIRFHLNVLFLVTNVWNTLSMCTVPRNKTDETFYLNGYEKNISLFLDEVGRHFRHVL